MILLYLHIPKAGGTTLAECIYNEMQSDEKYEECGGWFNSGVYYYPTGFSENHNILHTSIDHDINEALVRTDLRAVVGHFSFGLHTRIPQSSIYVSMLREPVQRVLSLYHHLKWVGELPYETSVAKFIYKAGLPESENDQVYRISGLPRTADNLVDALDKAIENITQYFAFVGVTELFDESLVLMKKTLGWHKDLAYFARNVNPERPEEEKRITESDKSLIMEANHADIMLYNHVRLAIEQQIRNEDTSFAADVANLRKVRANWEM